MQAWPFGCYPTFERIVGDRIPDLRIEAVRDGGTAAVIPDGPSTGGGGRAPQDWALAWRSPGSTAIAPTRRCSRRYWGTAARSARAARPRRGAGALLRRDVLGPARRGWPATGEHASAGELPLPITSE